jgi:hypothetical protein
LFCYNGKIQIANQSNHIKVFINHLTTFELSQRVCLCHVRQARVHRPVCIVTVRLSLIIIIIIGCWGYTLDREGKVSWWRDECNDFA